MARYPDVTGIILAGGAGRRLGGRCKALMTYRGRRFIDYLVDLFTDRFDRNIIVTPYPENLKDLGLPIVPDRIVGLGAAMGLLTGLEAMETDWGFVSACDTPLLQGPLIDALLAKRSEGVGAVLPSTPDGWHPLTAVYHRRCVPWLDKSLAAGKRSIRPLFDSIQLAILTPVDGLAVDPERRSFINVNTPADLERLRRLEAAGM